MPVNDQRRGEQMANGNLGGQPSKWSQRVETTNHIMQIIALLVAGTWAAWTWIQTTAPSLSTGLQLTGELTARWSPLSRACLGELTLTVENVGLKTIKVSRVEYKVERSNPQQLGRNESIKILDTLPSDSIHVGSGQFEILNGEYPPKAKAHQALSFLVHPTAQAEYWFRADLFGPTGNSLDYWFGAVEPCQREITKNEK